jgi:CRP-like cAMP-binding protein
VVALHTSSDPQEAVDAMHGFDAGDVIATFVLLTQFGLRFFVATPRTRNSFTSDQEHLVASSLAYARTFMIFEGLAILPMRLFTHDPVTSIVLGHFRLLALIRFPAILEAPKVQSISPVYIQFFYVWAPVMKNLSIFIVMVHCFAVVGLRFIQGATTYAAAAYQMLYLISGAGFGDIRPVTSNERVFLSFMCVVSMLLNGVVVGGIVSFLAQSDVEGMRRNRLLQTMAVLNFFEVPQTLQEEILQFQDHIMKKDIEVAFGYLTGHLPRAMKAGLTLQFRLALIQSVPVFERAHESTQVMLSQRLVQEVFRPETYVVLADETGDQMFFINYGFVDLFTGSGNYISTRAPGENFGTEAVFDPFKRIMSQSVAAGLITPGNTPSAAYIGSLGAAEGKYTLSAKTITYVEVLWLDSSRFAEVMEQFPRFRIDVETSVNDAADPVSKASTPPSMGLRTPKSPAPPPTIGLNQSDDDADTHETPTVLFSTQNPAAPNSHHHNSPHHNADDDPELIAELERELAQELSSLRELLLPTPASSAAQPVPGLEITESSPEADAAKGEPKEACASAPHPFDVDDEEL